MKRPHLSTLYSQQAWREQEPVSLIINHPQFIVASQDNTTIHCGASGELRVPPALCIARKRGESKRPFPTLLSAWEGVREEIIYLALMQ